MSKIKQHWFGILIGIISVLYAIMFLLVLFAPRQDKLNRGFIPCTKTMINRIFTCEENKSWCMVKAIVDNTVCDSKVIITGLTEWISGKQATPWANYLFTPKIEDENQDVELPQELEEYYAEHPDIATEMEQLNQDRLKLEKSLDLIDPQTDIPTNDTIEQDLEEITNEQLEQR